MPSLRILPCRSLIVKLVMLLMPSFLVLFYLQISDKRSSQASQELISLGHSTYLSHSKSVSHSRRSLSHSVKVSESVKVSDSMKVSDFVSQSRSATVYRFTEEDINKLHTPFSMGNDESDVMVFLHMQKTGGTFFGKNLVRNLQLHTPCRCDKGKGMLKCPCTSPDGKRYWLFSRYSVGWKCGLHADYTELTECLLSGKLDELEQQTRQRRYHYVTVLRDPMSRFVSEWQHVSRGASWIDSTHKCKGRSPTKQELPPCYEGVSWSNVTLEEFMACPHNLARNRQTRMLANLSLIGCYADDMLYNPSKGQILLESAKQTLRSFPYFSIQSLLNESQLLFEQTFDLRFQTPMFEQKNRHNRHSADILRSLPESLQKQILGVNYLDVQLYDYATQLFHKRYQYALRHLVQHSSYQEPYS